MGMYFDFDAWRKERNKEPFVIKAFGKEYELPSDVPFDVVLMLARELRNGNDGEVGEEQILEMANAIFGKETFDEWRKNGIGINEVKFLVEHVMSVYQQQTKAMAEAKQERIGGNFPK